MATTREDWRRRAAFACLGAFALLSGCGGGEPSSDSATSTAAPGTAPGQAAAPAENAAPPPPLEATDATWTPEALEELLAPVALYPDAVLAQVLTASTNPQEVLDAGNWLVANPDLMGKALDEGAAAAGFTPPIRGLIQSPQVIDQMCLNMGWTEEVGQAFVNDQAGVMDAVQRLRTQAQDVGNLESSEYLAVEEEAPPPEAESDAETVIKIEAPDPTVVYVPQYDPVAVYAPPPAQPAAQTTQPATTTQTEEGHSTGDLVTTGLLAFGAGILVNEVFDDDDWDDGYYGGMWYGGMPYYPPYPYRPAYGGGFYPSHNYVRNTNVFVNSGNNNYWDRYGNDRNVASNRTRAQSPITAARPNRPELEQLNAKAAEGPRRKAPQASDAWRGNQSYAGADPARRDAVENRGGGAAGQRPANAAARPGATPKVQGTYAGAREQGGSRAQGAQSGSRAPGAEGNRAARDATARPATQEARTAASSRPSSADRGHAATATRSTGASGAGAAPAARNRTAVSQPGAGQSDRAASARGRHSASQGIPQQARGSGQGGRRR